MPAWLIDLFGSRQLNQIFWLLTLAPLPIWWALVFFPRHAITKVLAWPWLVPPLLGLAYLALIWKAWHIGPPRLPVDVEAHSARVFLFHPIVFLVLWAHLQMANLFVGLVLRLDARRGRRAIPVELALCWLFAPLAVVLYAVRRLIFLRSSRSHDRGARAR